MNRFIFLLVLWAGFLRADSLSVFSVYGEHYSIPIVLINYGNDFSFKDEFNTLYRKNNLQPLTCWPGTCLYVGKVADTLSAKLQDMSAASFLASIQPISSLLIPQGYALQTDSILRKKFNSEREIKPFVVSFSDNRINRVQKTEVLQSIPVHFLSTKRVSKKLEIYNFDRPTGSDFLFFRLDHTLYKQLSVAEVLLFSEFLDWFFNRQLIPVGTKIHYKMPSFYLLTSQYFPVYLPEVMLITDGNTVINILSNWSRIYRRIIIDIKSEEIIKLRDELLDKLITIRDSPLSEAVFINKLAIRSGRIISPEQLFKQLRQINLEETTKRFELLVEQEWIDIHWDTSGKLNMDLLNKLQNRFKLTVHRKNKPTEGQRP